jgi:hypothetical protein
MVLIDNQATMDINEDAINKLYSHNLKKTDT